MHVSIIISMHIKYKYECWYEYAYEYKYENKTYEYEYKHVRKYEYKHIQMMAIVCMTWIEYDEFKHIKQSRGFGYVKRMIYVKLSWGID